MKIIGYFLCSIFIIGIFPIQTISTNFIDPITIIPQAHASTNANLFVSAENSQWNNYFAGPQVIQVVVADPDINGLDTHYVEPVVTVNGKMLRMAQATDGNWYGYFADRNQTEIASNTAPVAKKGLNFGSFCGPDSFPIGGLEFLQTKGFTTAQNMGASLGLSTNGTKISIGDLSNICDNLPSGVVHEHVIKQNKTLNTNALGFAAQSDLVAAWPIIQLYDFSVIPTTVIVDYQKSSGDQIVNLTFDRIPQNLITTTVDRSAYPQNAAVQTQINDPQLNIDPTEEDSWTWGTSPTNNTLYYEAFTRNGAADADNTVGAMQNLVGNLTTFMFNHNGKLTVNGTAQTVRVVDFQANGKIIYQGTQRGDPAVVKTLSITAGSQPLTMIETGGVNTGTFVSWDSAKKSEIVTADSPAIRGQSAVVRYNDISTSIVGGFSFASLTQTTLNGTWASGQIIPVTLTDIDDDHNSKLSERMFLWDPTYKRITTMTIGTPFTLSGVNRTSIETAALISKVAIAPSAFSGIVTLTGISGQHGIGTNLAEDEEFSARPIFNFTNQSAGASPSVNTNSALFVDLKTNMNTLLNTIHNTSPGNIEGFKGFNFINYDLRSFSTLNGATGGSISNVKLYLAYNDTGAVSHTGSGLPIDGLKLISIANSTQLQDFINLNVTSSKVENPLILNNNLFGISNISPIGLLFQFTVSGGLSTISKNGEPVVADFFSVGLIGDGSQNSQRINNGIYRYELEETGDNTGVFTGTNQYVMLNQLNIFDSNTYSSLRTISHDIKFVAIDDMLQSQDRAPQIDYWDLVQDGTNTQLSAMQDIQTHTGVVSFDNSHYVTGDTVTVTVDDLDLNVENDIVDIYTAVPHNTDPASDTIGKSGLGVYSSGMSFGSLLEIKFGGIRWSNYGCFATESNTGTAGGLATSLPATGFTLVETGPSTGKFTGTFEIPDEFCVNAQTIGSTTSSILSAQYADFSDAAGNSARSSDSTTVGTITPNNDVHHIFLKGVDFTPVPGLNISEIKSGRMPSETVHFLLQFSNAPNSTEINTLIANGIHLTDYATGNTYVASSKVSDVDNIVGDTNALWAGPFSSDFKISPILKTKSISNIPSWAMVNNTHIILTMVLNRDANMNDTSHRLNLLGGEIKAVVGLIPSITAVFNRDEINELAQVDAIQWIDVVEGPLLPQNDEARIAANINILNQNYGLKGSGVTVMLYDEGGVFDHPDLHGRVTNQQSSIPSLHSTHVAGILGGDGRMSLNSIPLNCATCSSGTDHQWVGMAPEVKILSYAFNDVPGGRRLFNDGLSFSGAFTNALMPAGTNIQKIDLASMSLAVHVEPYGGPYERSFLGQYSPTADAVDQIVTGQINGNHLIIIEAAGNNRDNGAPFGNFSTIDPPATAKDSIAVGAITAENPPSITDFTSFGPTNDTRLKPDIVAPGCHGLSPNKVMISTGANGDQPTYDNMCGTSMATPVVSGATALLIQEWHLLYGQTPLLPSTTKAILIHTATDLGNPGPDYKFGWGALNAKAAIDLIIDNKQHGGNLIHQENLVNGGQTILARFHSNGGQGTIRATLVWDDPHGMAAAGFNLVNDLDLQLISPDKHIFYPFVLDPVNKNNTASTGIDRVNNVEMVVAPQQSGDWEIKVIGTRVAPSSQSYSLIVSETGTANPAFPFCYVIIGLLVALLVVLMIIAIVLSISRNHIKFNK